MTFRASLLSAVPVIAMLALAAVFSSALEGQEPTVDAKMAAEKMAAMKAEKMAAMKMAEALMNPLALIEEAPATFKAQFDTTKGTFVIEVRRDWAPHGADRFYNLVKSGYYSGNRFYRVTPEVATFGIHPDTAVSGRWLKADTKIANDPEFQHTNAKGTVALLQRGGRQTMTIISKLDNPTLDFQITPFGEVVSGMDVVEKLYGGYGESIPTGNAPTMNDILGKGDGYIMKEFPLMDRIEKAFVAT